jgi:hypothetical protein
MLRSNIAQWSYQLGCISAIVAVVYRALWLGSIGARLFGGTPRIVPHNFVDLSILLLVISIATNANAMLHHEGGKPAKTA